MNEDEAIQNITKKIEREKALINAANAMRSQTNNEAVRSRLDSQMRDGRRNLQFFEEKLRDIQMRKVGHGVEGMSLGGDDGPPAPPPKTRRLLVTKATARRVEMALPAICSRRIPSLVLPALEQPPKPVPPSPS